jgi:uncharacterized protein (DUF111 family)
VTAERLLVLDAQLSGIAGDMLVGALLDLGASPDVLRKALEAVGAPPFEVHEVSRGALRAKHFDVHLDEPD